MPREPLVAMSSERRPMGESSGETSVVAGETASSRRRGDSSLRLRSGESNGESSEESRSEYIDSLYS
tara:strand:+ start:606 stop:806 length:201 start_codon:yes stop_codon:yes gene_type:complete